MVSKSRAKFGYLTYEKMLGKIESGSLDAYDVIFSPDTKECYVIDPDLKPWAVKSKVYTFDSTEDALEQLNHNADTYPGQIVAIKHDDKYWGYIVNPASGGYSVTPLSEHVAPIDYNNLGNRPIINVIGEIGNPVIISDLSNGVYAVTGQFKIAPEIQTTYSSTANNIFVIEKDDIQIYIKRITAKEIKTYSILDGAFTESTIVTDTFLKENGYVTENYIDVKLAALDIVTRAEVEEYVGRIISDSLDATIDEKIAQQLEEFIQPVQESDIDNLFNN